MNNTITEEMQFDFNERCAIFEIDGKYERPEAQKRALDRINLKHGKKFELNDFELED